MNSDKTANPADTQAEPTGNPADITPDTLVGKPDDVAGNAAEEPARKKRGAPFGNSNRLRHGMRSQRHGLIHPKLGPKFGPSYGQINKLRKAIEQLIIKRHGSVSLVQQAKIQSILRLETGCRCMELLERKDECPTAEELRTQRHSIAQWTRERDNLLAEVLGMKPGENDPWAALDATQQAMPTSDTPSGNDTIVDAASDVGRGSEGNVNE